MGIIKRNRTANITFTELQAEMANAVNESMIDLDQHSAGSQTQEDAAADPAAEASRPKALPDADWQAPPSDADDAAPTEPAPRLTSHTQNRLSALGTFENIYNGTQHQLGEVNAKLASITTFQHSIREIINILHGEIHRANELELANVSVLSEHRKLYEQFQDSTRKLQERESLVDRLQQREASLIQDNEVLRVELAAARLEHVEAGNTIARHEAEIADLQKMLATRSADNDRRSRENEALREKYVQISLELDKAQKREAETRHRLDELTAIHANEGARHSELLNTLAASEKEVLRLQKALDLGQVKQAELVERMKAVDDERASEAVRHEAEIRGLRSELQALQARLNTALQDGDRSASALAELQEKLSDALAEQQVAEEKLVALARESETDKSSLLAANASLSEITLRRASEQIELDVRIQECEDLKAEIAALNAQIKELLPYERLHRVTQARETASRVADFAAVPIGPVRPAVVRRPNGAGRRRNA